MAEFAESIMIRNSPDAVWELVGSPERIHEWLPFIAQARVDGAARFCVAANGAELQERLVSRDERGRSYQYTIEKAPMPIEDLLATIAVSPAGDSHALVTWHTTVEPSDLVEVFTPIYQEGLQNLRSLLES